MRNFLNFFPRKYNVLFRAETGTSFKRKNGKIHVAMFSDFFSNLSEDVFCTNAMYAQMKEDLIDSINIYSPKEKIVMDILEKTPS